MLASSSRFVVSRITRATALRTFTSTSVLGEQYDVVIIGMFYKRFSCFPPQDYHFLICFKAEDPAVTWQPSKQDNSV